MERENPYPEREANIDRAEEQAYAEKLERDLVFELKERMSKKSGIMDRPEVFRSMKHVEEVLNQLATLRSSDLADIQDMREHLNQGTLDQEIERLENEIKTLGPEIEKISPQDLDDGSEAWKILNHHLEVQSHLVVGKMLREAKVKIDVLEIPNGLEDFLDDAVRERNNLREAYTASIQEALHGDTKRTLILKNEMERVDEELRIARKIWHEKIGSKLTEDDSE